MRPASLLAVAALAWAACRSETPIPTGPSAADSLPPTRVLTRIAGDGQTGIVGTDLPAPLEVVVRDSAGAGVPDVLVQFAVVGTSASLIPHNGLVPTGSDGRARVRVTLGTRADSVHVAAASPAAIGTAAWDLVATPSPVLALFVVSGDSQVVALPGSTLEPLVVAVRDRYGNRVSARPAVVFRVAAGAATFGGQDSLAVVPDTAGVASAALTSPAPADGDTVRVTASSAGMAGPPLPSIAVGLGFRGPTWEAGPYHACLLSASGQAYCWGLGNYGQLGDGGTANQAAPVAVAGGANFLSVSAGYSATCGLDSAGGVACWGASQSASAGTAHYRSISAGWWGVSGSGTVRSWGYTGTTIGGPVRFASVSGGNSATCGLTAAGQAWCWGSNAYGSLGAGDWTPANGSPASITPRAVAGGLTFQSTSSGYYHTCGLTPSGTAYCWGLNGDGQLGVGRVGNANAPMLVAGGLTFSSISAGGYHTCALTAAGAAYCWGDNAYGQVGNGQASTSPVLTPTPVSGGVAFASIGTGFEFTCGVAVGGAAYCWGDNTYGQVGNGTIGGPAVTAPTPVVGGILFRP